MKPLLIVLLVIPFWVSYLLRMLAWIGLLSTDGYVNKMLIDLGIAHPPDWLNGNAYSVIIALVYGYIPYFILPVFAGIDRIDSSQIEAARDLGATPWQAFLRVTLPLSRPSILAGSALVVLPMFGDYYTNDLISASPRTNMLGNEINLFVQGGSEKNLGASLVLVLMAILAVVHGVLPVRRPRANPARTVGVSRGRLRRARLRNPWGKPRFLVARHLAVHRLGAGAGAHRDPVLVQPGRSRSVWQGFSTRWWWGDPEPVDLPRPAVHPRARPQPRSWPALDMLIATPLGVLLALGLTRWRGRGSGGANGLMLVPLVTPEIVMAVSLLLVFTQLAIVPVQRSFISAPPHRWSAR